MTPAVEALERAGVAFTLHRYAASAADDFGREAAEAMGQDPDRVFKTLIVALQPDELVVAVVPVSRRLNLKALRKAAGASGAALAERRVAEQKTGYVMGGISPFGQRRRLRTFVDRSAGDAGTLFVSGGRRGVEIEIAAADLVRVLGAELVPLAAVDGGG